MMNKGGILFKIILLMPGKVINAKRLNNVIDD
jgi:hypothetical protein